MAKTALLLALLPLLLPFSSLALTQDFCVANLTLSDTPAGYPCKPQTSVTANDFFYEGLAAPGPSQAPFTYRLGTAFAANFTGLNGLGLGATRVDISPGGAVPLHTHPDGSELLFVTEGSMAVGFISSTTNTVYAKNLQKGDLFVIPQGLLHFQYNTGKMTTVGLAVYSSSNPGAQIVDNALFVNNLPPDIVKKITFLDESAVRRLEALFGGSS